MRNFPDLNMITENFWEKIKDVDYNGSPLYLQPHEFDVYAFPQLWGSTALGFGGIGGQAMTEALTVVVIHRTSHIAGVYFDGELAYIIKDSNQKFVNDLNNRNMAPVWESGKYKRKEKEKNE